MDPEHSLQDVVRCILCETPGPIMYCDICHIHLCKACVGEHLLDESKEHKVVTFKNRGLNPKCPKHSTQLCDLYCEKCDIPICLECVSSSEHLGHQQTIILKLFHAKKAALHRDLQELENFIFPKYQEIASNIPVQRADLIQNSEKLTVAIIKFGEELHRKIDFAIRKMKSDVIEKEFEYFVELQKKEDEMKYIVSKVTKKIADLTKLLNSNDVVLVSAYKSRNAVLRKLPPRLTVSLPKFTLDINEEQIHQCIDSLSVVSIKTEKPKHTVSFAGAWSSPLDRPFDDVPRLITEIITEYGEYNELHCVSCQRDTEVWTCGQDNIMRLYDLHGKLVNSIQTKSGNMPINITLTQRGELVYTDYDDRSLNIVKNTQIQTLIRLLRWLPLCVCSTSSNDLLVVMVTDKTKQTKVVRYSGSKEKQVIQYDDKGQALYSSDPFFHISENRNLDICVADNGANAVVVVNQAGKLRFTYTGPLSITKKPFYPVGITTDSQSRILTADIYNQCIHTLDQDGQFLFYIDNCQLDLPWGLSLDTKDNIFVVENETGKVKKIQYYM